MSFSITRAYIPFLYFQQTRLRTAKDFIFHFAYEWLPALILIFISNDFYKTIFFFALYYGAFISVYEIGYLVNDQLALKEENGRRRSGQFSILSTFFFIAIRLGVFLVITFYFQNNSMRWWLWYGLLVVFFAAHNTLRSDALKCITFLFLAFARFFSPVLMVIDEGLLQILAMPIALNYALFRLFTYMDSKNLLNHFNRSSNTFRVGYYLLLIGFSILLALISKSYIPLIVNAYYLITSVLFAFLSYCASRWIKRKAIN